MASDRISRVAYALDVVLVGLFIILPAHAYEWMKQMDPTMEQLPADPRRSARIAGTLVALLLVAAFNGVGAVRAPGRGRRLGHALIILGLTTIWFVKFVQ
jgi:hypothetical protein